MNFHAIHSFIDAFFTWVWSNSLATTVLIVLALALQFVFRRFLAARWLYALWFCVLLRLLMREVPWSRVSTESHSCGSFRLIVNVYHYPPFCDDAKVPFDGGCGAPGQIVEPLRIAAPIGGLVVQKAARNRSIRMSCGV